MKKFGSTIVFAAIVAAFSGYAVFEYRKSVKEEEMKPKEGRLYPLMSTDQVKSIFYKGSDGEVEITKDSGVWKIVKPIADNADSEEIEGYLTKLFEMDVTIPNFKKGEVVNWKQYGLDQVGYVLELATADGTKHKIEIGDTTFDEGFYIRRDGGNELIAGPRTVGEFRRFALDKMRDRRVSGLSTDWDEFQYKNHSDKNKFVLDLKREGGRWISKSSSKVVWDEGILASLIQSVQGLRGDAVVTPDANLKKKYSMNAPIVAFQIRNKNEKSETQVTDLFVSKEVDLKAYVQVGKQERWIEISPAQLTELKKSLVDLRDKKAHFRWSSDKASTFLVKRGDKKVLELKKDLGEWAFTDKDHLDNKNKIVNKDKVGQLFDKISNMAVDVFTEQEKLTLGTSAQSVMIEAADLDNNSVLALMFGGEIKKDGKSFVTLKSSQAPTVVAIEKSKLQELVDFQVWDAKPEVSATVEKQGSVQDTNEDKGILPDEKNR
jgi:hypothetical protein